MLNDFLDINEHGLVRDLYSLEVRMRGGLGRNSLIKNIFDWCKDVDLKYVVYTCVNLYNAKEIRKLSFIRSYLQRNSEIIRDAVDSEVFNLITNDYKGFTYGTKDNPIKLTDKSIKRYLVDLYVFAQSLTGSNNLVLVVPPKVKTLLLRNFKDFEIFNKYTPSPIQNGYIGRLQGFEVYCSTNLFTNNNTTCMLAMSRDFLKYGDAVQVLDQKYHEDINLTQIIAKYKWGFKVENPHGCVTMFVEV